MDYSNERTRLTPSVNNYGTGRAVVDEVVAARKNSSAGVRGGTDAAVEGGRIQGRSKLSLSIFIILALLLQFFLLAKPILYNTIQYPEFAGISCKKSNFTKQYNYDLGFVSTSVIVTILFLLRCFEALVFEIALFHYFKKKSVNFGAIKVNTCKKILVAMIFLYMIVTSMSVLVFGIALELMIHEPFCITAIHMSYWFLDFVSICYAVGVRTLMVVATVVVMSKWNCNLREDADRATEEPITLHQYAVDRDVIIKDYKECRRNYTIRGNFARKVSNIFSAWFIIPWLIYFSGLSLDFNEILRPWTSSNNSYSPSDLPQISFTLHNANQLSLLSIPYICSLLINSAHKNYLKNVRANQMKKYKTASRKALAALHIIDRNEDYDFSPRVFFTNVHITLQAPLYVFFLIFGSFFTLFNDLI